jgi:ketosteroid isomerase-like protein
MTATRTALETALTYHRHWTGDDFDKAMACIADDVVCDAPFGRFEGAAAFRGFLEPFAQRLIGSTVIAGFGDDRSAVIVYDTTTALVPSGPAADHVTVEGGRITRIRMIFDRLPGVEARRAAEQA